jgi:hypothetical protein
MNLAVLSLSQRKVLQALTLQLKALGDGPQSLMPIEMQGSGMQNMVMVTTLLRYIAEDPKVNLILAFEEPEYSLEPFNQRLLAQELRNIKSKRVQLFVTIHSPEIVNAMMGHDLQVLRRIPTGHELRMASDLKEPVQKSFELNSIFAMTQGLFARRVLLVEGASERSGLPVFLEQLKKEDRFSGAYELGIEMIEAYGIKEIPPYAEVFSAFGTSVAALVDYDAGSTPEKQAENQKRRDDIKKAADYVFQLPDSDEARNYDAVVVRKDYANLILTVLQGLDRDDRLDLQKIQLRHLQDGSFSAQRTRPNSDLGRLLKILNTELLGACPSVIDCLARVIACRSQLESIFKLNHVVFRELSLITRSALRRLSKDQSQQNRISALLREEVARVQFLHVETAVSGRYVLTIHQAKGKEFDIVLLPYCLGRYFGEDQQDRMKFYVALTRAKKGFIIFTPSDPKQQSPLLKNHFLCEEIDDALDAD